MNKIFFITFITLLFFGCDQFERYDSQFKNYEELIKSQSWKGGWVPKIVPKDAVNIKESHYIDHSSVILSFEFSNDFKGKLDGICKEINFNDIQFSNINAKWWPNSLEGNAFGSSHEYHYYSCPDIGGYFAIPFGIKKAYFWSLNSI